MLRGLLKAAVRTGRRRVVLAVAGLGALAAAAVPALATNTVPIGAMDYDRCVVGTAVASGGPVCWGVNDQGQIGDGTTTARTSPVEVIPEDALPDAPTSLSGTPGDGSLLLKFLPPADNGTGAVTGYDYSTDAGTTWHALATTAGTGSFRTATIGGLTNGSAYQVTVRARNADGAGPAAATVDLTLLGAPHRPQAVTAVAGTSSIAVSWTAPAAGGADVTGYTAIADPGKGAINTAAPGQQIVVIGTGFAAHSTVAVTIYSAPTALGTVVTDANGNFSLPVTVPAGLPGGRHTVVAQSAAPDGSPRAMNLTVTVGTAATGPGNGGGGNRLPVTGSPTTRITAAGLVLLVLGAGLLRITRRRRMTRRRTS